MDLRARKQEMVRREIVNAAFSLFSAHGFDGTTVEMIAEEAVVSPRTVYRYFDSKETIVFAGIEGFEESLLELVRDRCAGGVSLQGLFGAFAAHLDGVQQDSTVRTLTALMRDNAALQRSGDKWRRGLQVRIGALLAELQERSEPSLEDQALAGTVCTVSGLAVARWAVEDHRGDLGERVLRAGRAVEQAARG